MKINPFDPSSRPSAPAQRPAAAKEDDFARLLAESQEKKLASSGGGLEALNNDALAGRLLAARPPEEAGPAAPARRQLEKTLDQMDLYAAALGDPGRGLKEIAPLADGLGEAADRLSQLSRKLPESDPLKGLSNEASVLAAVEALKFKRGDYI